MRLMLSRLVAAGEQDEMQRVLEPLVPALLHEEEEVETQRAFEPRALSGCR